MLKRTLGITLVLLVTGVFSWFASAGVKSKSDESIDLAPFQLKRVEAITLEVESRYRSYRAACKIGPENIYNVSAKDDGEVTFVKTGINIAKKGDLLMEIDNETLRHQHKTALNTLKLHELNLKRYSEPGVARPVIEIDDIELKANNARSEVNYYQSRIDSFRMVAPEDGLFEVPAFEVGDRIQGRQPLIRFYGSNQFEVSASIPLQVFSNLNLAGEMELRSIEDDTVIAKARYSRHEPEREGEFVKLFGEVTSYSRNQEALFEKCTVTLGIDEAHEGIFLDNKYVYLDYRGFYVFKLNGRRVKKQYVHTAWYDDGVLELQSGFKPGEMVATAGSFKLIDNELVDYILVDQ